ncbi:MAG: hypothetical protein V4858_17185 [Pseudomonadota bacterium]
MEQENPTSSDAGASTLDRLDRFLATDEAPETPAPNPSAEGDQPDGDEALDVAAQESTEDPEKVAEPEQKEEPPNEYQLSDFAKLLGADESMLDVDAEGNVLVKTKVDGQEGTVKFPDLLKSYQLQSHVDKQVREVAEQRKAVQEQREALQQQAQVQQAVVEKIAVVKSIEASINQYQALDWNTLYEQDPAQAAKLDRQMRDLQQKHQQAVGEVNQAGQKFQEEQQRITEAALVTERQALFAAAPEWTDPAKAEKDKAAIKADLLSRGYTEKEILGLTNHKTVLLARDAMLWRTQQAANKTTEKVVRAAPKIIKPGSSQPVNRQAQTVQTLKTSVRKGDTNAVRDYLLATNKV